jgi:Domain of unknown function (DUF4136)
MRKRPLLIVTVTAGLFLWGCYPEGPTYTEDLDIVITHHNPDYNFVAKSTYAMPDAIVKITGNLSEGDVPEFIPDAYASQITARIAANMESLGWQRVAVNASPDILLTTAEWETTTVLYYYDYWSWWWGGYYPSYPYYPTYGGSYTTGTLLMIISDPSAVGGNGYPIQQWTGAINGILNDKFNPDRVLPLVDQAFKQSPYLKTN